MSVFKHIAFFQLTVTATDGRPVEGAVVTVTAAAGTDVTAAVTGLSPAYTFADGKVIRFGAAASVTPGVYTITVSAPGYPAQSLTTPADFSGPGSFVLVLSRVVAVPPFTVTAPPDFVSVYAPVPLTYTFTGADKPALLELSIRGLDGTPSLMRLGVDAATGSVTAYLQPRIRLAPRPVFVPAGQLTAVDPYFTDSITVTAAVYYGPDRVALPGQTVFQAANLYPPESGNDLAPWATGDAGGLIRWICPARRPVVTPGYYYDALLWLPPLADMPPGDVYLLKRRYYLGDGTTLVQALSDSITPDLRARRVVLSRGADTSIRRAVYHATDSAGNRMSHDLTVQFND